ncbi:MAG TPA: ATP-binding protein [Phycisphaerae bacterium]|nr:ATP-binding protein [Phycisphaerae bacterium]HRY70175.1 ATP-binding protein [Phycisphaerae bacterium]HSA27390.1 ATP-binding protein [Phycisphaerae bacterium]
MIYLNLVNNISLLVALSVVHSLIIRRWKQDTTAYQVASGLLFGGASIVGMWAALTLTQGIIFDGRSIMISIAGLFGGPISAGIAAVMAAAYRTSLGGGGVVMGVSVAIESAVLGVAWHYLRRRHAWAAHPLCLLGFGILVHIVMLALTSTLPADQAASVFLQIAIPVITIYPVATVLVCMLFLDQEARLRADKALRESEERYRLLFERANDAIFLVEKSTGRYLDANQAAEELIGRSRTQLRELTTFDLAPEGAEDRLKQVSSATPACELGEITFVRPDGSTRVALLNAVSLNDRTVFGMARDITERILAERELAEYRDHLEELVEARTQELIAVRDQARRVERLASLGTLSAGIAHEINNPVGGILLTAQSALAAGRVPDHLIPVLDDIVKNAERCKTIVQNFRRFARAEETVKTPCSLNSILRNIIALTREYAAKNQCDINIILEEPAPLLRLNSTAMEQVGVNLIRNAIEAGASRVTIQTLLGTDTASFTIEDNGRGIPDEDLPRLFDPFYTTRQSQGGMGLGLSVVHGIIQDHNGTILVTSEPGKGTEFTVTIPLDSQAKESQ